MASSVVNALIDSNHKLGAFAQTQAGQDFMLELERAIEAADQAAAEIGPLTDMRAVELQAAAAVQQAAETRVANLLTVIRLVVSGLA